MLTVCFTKSQRITSFVRGREASDTELRDTIASKGSTAGVPNVGKEVSTNILQFCYLSD